MPKWLSHERVLAALLLAALIMQIPIWKWLVEDAAISYAYARNIAEGFGAVPFPGGERVEGFSNPLWTALYTVLIYLGAYPFAAEPWVGLIVGLGAILATWQWGRQLPGATLFVTFVIATSAQHAIWSQSGLENPMFSLFLALGGWRLAAGDHDDVGAPLAFLGLTLTRPEGIAYALVAGVLSLWSAGSGIGILRRIRAWIMAFVLPWSIYQGFRYAYFALELPATFYAKIGDREFDPLKFNTRAWNQLREFVLWGGMAPWLALLPLGASGLKGPRAAAGAVVAGMIALACLPIDELARTRAATFVVAFTALPLLALGDPNRRSQLFAACFLWVGALFLLRSGGDWMSGHRFVSLCVVPAAVLLGSAAYDVLQEIPPPWRVRVGAVLAVAFLAGQITLETRFALDKDTTPHGVRKRVRHYRYMADTLDLDRQITAADHDMGGLMYWGPPWMVVRDTRGLVDLPFAHHGWKGRVVDEELEHRTPPDVAHAHGTTGVALKQSKWYRKTFIEVPGGFPREKLDPHKAQVVRRSLFLSESGPDSEAAARFVDGVTQMSLVELRGARIESPEVSVDAGLFLEVGVHAPVRRPFRMVAFLHREGEVVQSWDVPPAHDWVPVTSWRREEVFHGKFRLRLSHDLAPGRYQVGVAAFRSNGRALSAVDPAGGVVVPDQPVFAAGEVWLPHTVLVGHRALAVAASTVDLTHAFAHADAEACEAAEASWDRARHHLPRAVGWHDKMRPVMAEALAACWAERARGPLKGTKLHARVADLRRGRAWMADSPEIEGASHRVSAKAWHRGVEARKSGESEAAFVWFNAAVNANPSMSWARRYAEEARAERWARDEETAARTKRRPVR